VINSNNKKIRRTTAMVGCSFMLTLTGCETLTTNFEKYSGKFTKKSLQSSQLQNENVIENVNKRVLSQGDAWQANTITSNLNNSGWIDDFNDPLLKIFVKVALNSNPDLKASAAKLEASIASAAQTNSNKWPKLSLSFTPKEAETKTPTEEDPDKKEFKDSMPQNLGVSWEADIWGKLSAQRKAAAYTSEVEAAEYKAAQHSLVANVARAWYSVITNKLSLENSRKQLLSLRETLSIAEDSYNSGLTSALDLYLNRADIANREAAILSEEDSFEQSVRAFKQLLGGYPSTAWAIDAGLPDLNETVPAGLPSELLSRRPDVLASLRRYQAAQETAKAAHKAKLPSVALTSSYGGISDGLKLLNSSDLFWELAANITAPLFRGGELKAQANRADIQTKAETQRYLSTLINAFAEVENGLSSEEKLRRRLGSTEQASFYYQSAYDLATEQYKAGLTSFTTLLESQRRWFTADSSILTLKNALLQNRINLYLSLGGDFTSERQTKTLYKK